MAREIDGYNYYISNDSDDECRASDSSEDEPPPLDEVNVFLNGTQKQKQKALKRLAGNEESSSEDEFEAEMKNELANKIKTIETSWKDGTGKPSSSKQQKESSKEYYNDIYFDSDDEATNKTIRKRKKSNDELFYDPSADDKDQQWVDKQRLRGSAVDTKKNIKESKPKQKQDKKNEMLICPACLTTVCIDCQRHETYHNQYRAMFVMNCKVITEEKVSYKEPKKKIFKRKRKINNTESSGAEVNNGEDMEVTIDADNVYHPVKCTTCDTEVAVYDNDEVYHFFNVVTGQP